MFTVSPSLSLSLSFSSICVYYVPDNRRDYYRRAMIHARIDQVCSNFAASKKFRNRCRRRVRRLRSRASFGTSRCSRTNSRARTRRTHERVTILRSPGMENRVNRRDASTASSRSGRSERRLEFPVSMRSRAAATRQLFRKGEKEREREVPDSPASLRTIDTRESYHRPVVIVRARLFTTYARKAAIGGLSGEWKSTVGLIADVTGDIFNRADLSSIDRLGYRREFPSPADFRLRICGSRLRAGFVQLQRSLASSLSVLERINASARRSKSINRIACARERGRPIACDRRRRLEAEIRGGELAGISANGPHARPVEKSAPSALIGFLLVKSENRVNVNPVQRTHDGPAFRI